MKTYVIPGEGVFEEMLETAREDLVEIRTDEALICADFLQRFIRAAEEPSEKVTCNVTKAGGKIFMYVRVRAEEGADAG